MGKYVRLSLFYFGDISKDELLLMWMALHSTCQTVSAQYIPWFSADAVWLSIDSFILFACFMVAVTYAARF